MAREYAEESPKREYAPREVSPTSPEAMEPGLEPVGLAESFIVPVKGYTAAMGALKGAEAIAGKYGAPKVAEALSTITPKTGRQLLGQAGAAGTAGVAGELASRKAPPEYKGLARTGTELITGGVLGLTPKFGRGATPSIPKERIESAKYLREKGGFDTAPSYEQVTYGPEAAERVGRLSRQQGVANTVYNESVGLTPKKSFGKNEFDAAQNKASNDYKTLLDGRTVYFDDAFFSGLEKTLAEQQNLAASGISFGQSRAIIGALEKIGNVPKNLKSRIDSLPRIGEEEVTAKESQEALAILNEMIPAIRSQGKVEMPATAYNEIRSILGDAAARTTNNRNARVLRQMQGAFDQAADRSMPDIVRDLEGVRRRYEALKTLEEAQLRSGVEIGVIPADAVGAAIRNRIEQGAIYGTNNPLRQIGEAGQALGMVSPVTGRRLGQEITERGTKSSTLFSALKDLLSVPVYPVKRYMAGRRLEEVPSAAYGLPSTAAAVLTEPERKK